MRTFVDKVVVITGAGSGIGRATALAFARLGADLHVVDVREEAAQSVAEEVRKLNRPAWSHQTDCSNYEAMEALAAKVYEQSGAVHVLHNNAGIGHGAPIEETTEEDWRRVLEVNLFGPIHGVTAFLPRMLEQPLIKGRRSHIVNTSSILGLLAVPGMAPYCTSKFGLIGMSEALAAELEPRGIAVTAICPGIISTNIIRTSPLGGSFEEKRQGTVELYDRFGATPERVAEDVVKAVVDKKVVAVSPGYQVRPLWMLKRASMPAYARIQRLMRRYLM